MVSRVSIKTEFPFPGKGLLSDQVETSSYEHIEHQLAHAVHDPNGRAYNRTEHLVERKRMMNRWAAYLDELREKARHANL